MRGDEVPDAGLWWRSRPKTKVFSGHSDHCSMDQPFPGWTLLCYSDVFMVLKPQGSPFKGQSCFREQPEPLSFYQVLLSAVLC